MATEDVEIEIYGDDDLVIFRKDGKMYSYDFVEISDVIDRLIGAGATYDVYSQVEPYEE